MERLTARTEAGRAYLVNVKPDEQEVDSPHRNTLQCILDCFERLAQYEDAEQEREKGCEYCATDVMDGNPIIHKHASGYIGNRKFSSAGSCKTRFCPNCGCKMEDKPCG